jgi:hypothetical protein
MSEANPTEAAHDGSSLIVVDLGKRQKAKQIRKLRKGGGKLTEKIKELVDELREQRAISADAQPIIIVVREKPARRKAFGL